MKGQHRQKSGYAGDSSPIYFKVTPLKIAAILAANTLIALFVSAIYPDSSFFVSFVYSQCVGISIGTCSITATNYIKTATLSRQLSFIAVSVVIGAVIGMALGGVAVQYFFPGTPQVLSPAAKYTLTRSNLALALLFGAIITYVFFSLQKMSDEKIKRLEVEKNAIVTEIRLLQSQLEPHFLFNTLSNVLGLIDREPAKARKMLEAFTSFLRSSLVTSRNETITLAQEMDVARNYLDIFVLRMGERLRYAIDVAPDLQSFPVPPLIVQPLVENAVKHGLEPSISGGEIRISAAREGDRVRITVADSGLGINELSPGSGIGVENIKKRLELVYDGRARLVFEENEPKGLKAVIELPYETVTSHHR